LLKIAGVWPGSVIPDAHGTIRNPENLQGD